MQGAQVQFLVRELDPECNQDLRQISILKKERKKQAHSRQKLVKTSVCAHAQSLSSMRLFVTPWTMQPARLLCLWDFPGKNTRLGHFLFQRIFLTQGLNPHLLHWQADSLPVSH